MAPQDAEFFSELLDRASTGDANDDTVLELILDRARGLTSSDAGGGLVVLEVPVHGRPELAVAHGALGEHRRAWWRARLAGDGPARSICNSGRPVLSGQRAAGGGVGSSLWVPLLEGQRRVVGLLVVEASTSNHYREHHVKVLQGLMRSSLPAVARLQLRRRLAAMNRSAEIVGVSPAFLDLERRVRQTASFSGGAVLITGERGVGKEWVAHAVHAWSDRRQGPFVPVLASAFSPTLVTDELFGHEKHAFTGADSQRLGSFGAAHGGTLFLDEVGDLPLPLQGTLLRIVDKGELPRIGRDIPLAVDVRVIAATNRDLHELMRREEFRCDLYDRLHVFELHVPPLRLRREDVRPLALAFLRRHCRRLRRFELLEGPCRCQCLPPACTGDGFFELLESREWPGNVRELENLSAGWSPPRRTRSSARTTFHAPSPRGPRRPATSPRT